jgi:23S rRNA pseudouridine2605 synthase
MAGTTGVARALSKLGVCSRSRAQQLVREGAVRVNGRPCRDPDRRVNPRSDRLTIHGRPATAPRRVYLALNKPRGLVTTRSDEKGRATVYHCFTGADLPWIAPAGRLDQASEGLLLFSNASAWNAAITDPAGRVDKTYHVQVNRLPDADFLALLERGFEAGGEWLAVKSARELRRGGRNAWLELIVDEGRNRHLRRLLQAAGVIVLRLVRVAIGPLRLGNLASGKWRYLTKAEVDALAPPKPRKTLRRNNHPTAVRVS